MTDSFFGRTAHKLRRGMLCTAGELNGHGFHSGLVVPLGFFAHDVNWRWTAEAIHILPLTHFELDSRRDVLGPCCRHNEQFGLAGRNKQLDDENPESLIDAL